MPITQHRNAKYWFSLVDSALLLRILDDLELIYKANSGTYIFSLHLLFVKFIYSEKATIFYEISTEDLSHVVTVKSTAEISQNFVAFSEYMNFKNTVTNVEPN